MQLDHVLKKLNFDRLVPTAGSGGGGGMRPNICYHVAILARPDDTSSRFLAFRTLNYG